MLLHQKQQSMGQTSANMFSVSQTLHSGLVLVCWLEESSDPAEKLFLELVHFQAHHFAWCEISSLSDIMIQLGVNHDNTNAQEFEG